MLSYETAKKLKDAGFPQGISEGSLYFEIDGAMPKNWHRGPFASSVELGFDKRKLKIPTLSELIQECGDDFKGIIRPHGDFLAVRHIGTIDKDGLFNGWVFHGGTTLEEAVANLYLSLHNAL